MPAAGRSRPLRRGGLRRSPWSGPEPYRWRRRRREMGRSVAVSSRPPSWPTNGLGQAPCLLSCISDLLWLRSSCNAELFCKCWWSYPSRLPRSWPRQHSRRPSGGARGLCCHQPSGGARGPSGRARGIGLPTRGQEGGGREGSAQGEVR